LLTLALTLATLIPLGLSAIAFTFPALIWWGVLALAMYLGVLVAGTLIPRRPWPGLVAVAYIVAASLLLGSAIPRSILADRGVTQLVRVVSVSAHADRGYGTYDYSLALPNGAGLPGGDLTITAPLSDPAPYQVGERITVRYDPDGQVVPRLPNLSDPTPIYVWLALGLALIVVMFGFTVHSGRLRARRR
jgi:hypothetical protein